MNLRNYLFLCGSAFLLFNAGCEQNPAESTTDTKASSISGIVLDEGNKPLVLARVIDLGTLAKEDTTKTDGSYKLQLQLTSNYNTSVLAILSGYMSDTQKVSLSPGDNLTSINIHMKVQDSSKIVSGSSGPAASIILVKQTANTIALWGTGPNVTSTLTFKVVDSTGTPVVGINRSMVNFVLSGGPGAGEFLRPAAALTDAIGEVSTTVTSGTKPGVLQVIASTRGDSVKTSPVFLVAGRGLPDSAGVSIAATKLNIAGRIFSNLSTSILLFVGDRFGNPVADGTSITFVSNGGIIMPSATTKDGVASVDLKSGGADAPPGGLVTVSASTTGDKSYRLSDSLITRQMHILFSGPTQPPILDSNAINLTIPNGGIRYFNFTVADDYGNPLVEGSTVTVTVKALDTLQNDLELLNNTKTFKDVLSHGETRISVGVHDKGNVSLAGIITFGIEIKSTNGDYSNGNWFQGYVAGGGSGPGTFNVPASIELVDSINTLYLAETNDSTNISKTLRFVVKDALNNPINAASKTRVAFSFLENPSGTTLSKSQDSTNSSGIVSVKINSGNTWGTAKVVASAVGETGLISATSLDINVARGLPDSTRIYLDLDKKNMFNKTGAVLGTLSINLIDKDGFPAAPQNDLRANTTGGYVTQPSRTLNGKTSLTLNGGSPEPNDPSPGFGNILVYVPVHGGVTVTKSQPFLFSYEPQIAYTKTSIIDSAANTLRASLADGGSVDVAFAVWDKNRNPISSDNSIKVTVSGPAVQELELSGDIDLKTTDTQVPLDAIHHFTIKNKSGGGKGDFIVTITVTGESGTSTRILNGFALPPVAAEKIALASEPLRILNVRGSGSNETSTLTFQVTNLTNNPIDGNNAVNVDLSVLDVLGGVTISPTRILTDGFGKAVVTLTSGNRYGTVRVVASFIDGSTTISSPQEVFNVTGPAMNNFALQISKNNLPGVGTSNPAIGTVTATVADSIGGSLPVGTRVNFRTLNGGAVTSTALTDANGVATANIKGGTIPNDPVRGMGFGTIQAWMVGNNGDTLKKSIPFLLSGPPATIYFTDAAGLPSTPLSSPIADGGSAYVYFKVRDINWRPVSSDYAITIAVEGDSGAIEVKNISTIRDIANMSDTSQICSFQLTDKIKGGGTSGPIKVTITVSNNDLGSNFITIPGTVAPAAGAISTRAAEINFVTSSTSPVYVRNTGLPSATTLTFALIDSNNHSVTLLKADNVLFSILNGTGQEWLSSTDTLSDANGQVTTTFHTGTKSGTFTVMAQMKTTPTIKASTNVTIIGGFPDPNKFTLQWAVTPPDTLLNLPGFVLNSVLANVNILALDKYSNPAKPSVIQFDETSGGSVGAVTTDASGRASASLSGGKPYPNEPSIGSEYGLVGPNRGFGFGFVKARTITENGTFLRDSVKFLFTGAPIITTNADSVGSVIINDGGSKDFSFAVSDMYGKAIATIPSSALKVTLTGAGPGYASLSLESDIPNNAQLPTNEVFPLTFHFKITDNTPNGGVSGNFQITIGVDGPLGHKEKIINGTLLPGISSYASSIQLLSGSPSASTISVKGTGATETSTMNFVVKDSSGNPVSLAKAATVTFSIVGGPGGGEFVSPTSAVTDANGQVTTTINSGTKSGVVIVIAKIGTTIQSSPVTVTIAGGLPDQNHLTVWTDKVNYPGLLGKGGTLGTVSVQVGDLYGNPVQPSSIYFSATGGGVSPANITTDATGSGQVNILGGNPSPAGGFDTITVATNGVGGVTVSKKAGVVFSGAPIVRVDSTNLGTISGGSSLLVNYAVADANGNPLASGNTINVTTGGTAGVQVQLSGDISVTTTDTKDTNKTKYQFTVANNVPQGGAGGSFTVTITVNGPNGTTTKILTGTLATPPAIVSGYASSVSLLSASTTSLAVNGSGGTQIATLTYVVKDSLSNPVTFPSRAAIVLFSLSDTTGGARVSPTSATTNTTGQVITVVTAGSIAKVVQVIAQVQGTSVYSTPTPLVISGGQLDANHMTVELSRKNYPGLVKNGTIGTVVVQVGDVNGNPVADNTPLSFATTAGLIDPSALAIKGTATVNLYGGLGYPTPVDAVLGAGYGTVTVSGIGVSGGKVSKSVPVLFSGAPAIITLEPTKVTGNALNASLAQKGSVTINFTIADANNRQLSNGNTFTVAASGAASSELQLSGDVNVVPADDTTLATYSITVTDKGGSGGAFTLTFTASGESGTLTKTITGEVVAPPPVVSGYASSIQLLAGSPSAPTISVKGMGATETSTMSFVVKDSLGNPVSTTRQAMVLFRIVSGPGGGAFVSPTSAVTDANGQVTTTVNAGTIAGVVQVIATTSSITSSPVTITIAGGLPNRNHLTVSTDKVNYPGLIGSGITLGTMTVQVGDLYGNPVQPSWIYFSATGGGINPASIVTDATGSGQVNILSGNPNPVRGFDTITVASNGVGGVAFNKKTVIVFSGSPIVTLTSTNLGSVTAGGSLQVNYTVADANGNPLASGNTISVTTGGTAGAQAQLSGNTSINTVDTKDTNTTKYQFTIANNVPQGGTGGSFTVTITVNGPNGTTTKTLTGILDTPPVGVSGVASSVAFLSASTRSLSVSGSGGTQTATLTYIVKDSLGNPVSFPSQSATVLFSLSDTTGGARVSPISTTTNTSGQVTTVVSAGSVAKVVQVNAQVQGTTIFSTPTSIVISGGQPDANHMTIALSRKNYPGLVKNGTIGTVTAQIKDVNGNPVADNTSLSFTTTAGSIKSSALTSNGTATVNLYGALGYPAPVDAMRGIGYGTVTVSGIGVGGVKVSKSVPVLFSGAPATITLDPTKVTGNVLNASLAQKGSVTVTYKIADVNNRQLSNGNTFSVTAGGDAGGELLLSGDVNVVPSDDTTLTTYSVTVTHKGGSGGAFTLTFASTGESGTLAMTINGTVVAPLGYASSIQLLAGSPSASTISVRGTGATETSTMSFVVKDSLGNPVSTTRQATVTFSIVGGPNGGEFVSPTSVVTDVNGQVTTTVNAGTKAGVMQVVATTTVNSTTITSAPVPLTIASGLADLAHFTVWTDKLNWPGWVSQGVQIGTVSVQMGDKYGNPVQPNTALYFTVTGGIIASSAFTDATGHASVAVYGGNPNPPNGIDTITVSTLGQGGVTITQKVTTVYSGAPIVSVDNTNLGTISVGSSLVVNYAVADANRNPIASGNAIGVTVGGIAGAQAQLSGDIAITTTDTKDTNTTKYQFTVANNVPQGGTGGSFTVTITVNGPNGTTTKILTGSLASPLGTITAPTQIILSSVSSSIVAASGTGGLSTSNLTFQALDAGGRAIGSAQSDTVFFSISDTAGGAHLIPTWAMSDANGQATTKLNAGTKYGVTTVTARLKTISSQPVPVRISGPSWTNFNVTISANNLPGLSQIGTIVGKLNVQIGDTLGNPVLPGTLIKFTTSGGMVDASAATDVNGSADINISGGATPNEPSLGGIGWGYVTAQTQGNSGTTLQKRVPFLFSGAPIITTVNVPSNDTLILLDAGFTDIDYKIADGNGNPLAAGNDVLVTVTGADAPEIVLSNYVDFSTNGTTDINQTTFRVRIADKLPSSGTGGYFDISIKVSGPNGISLRQFHGYLRAPGAITPPSPTAKMPAQIAFVSVSSTDIYVAGTGSTETSAITYEVRDSLGTLIDTHPRAFAQFSLQFFPNTTTNTGTQPRLIPNADSTDDNARLHVSVASGTQAGVVQVYAKIDLGGGNIVTSQPVKISVHAGFADQRHFTLAPKYFNFGGLDYAFWADEMTVQVADKYSNPVLPGTAVYFNTMHGAVGTGKSGLNTVGVTNIDGFVNQNLWSSNPFPEFADTINLGPGFSWVYARTLGESAAWVVDSALLVWTGQPIISNLVGPATFAIANGGSEGPWTFTIADKYGHPMAPNTTISVTGAALAVDGDANLTMPDIGPDQKTFIVPTGAGITTFTVVVSDADPGNVAAPPAKSLLTISITHPVYGKYTRVIASGTVQ